MARFDRGGPKGAKPNAGVAKPSARTSTMAPAIEDTMFFPRLRRHAKWMFVFLALVFAVGFVGFGVGAGGTGIGDILRDSGGTGDLPSVSEARKQTQERPQDAQAWRDLSTALQTEGETAPAIDALVRYTELKTGDAEAQREMAGLYLALANAKQNEAAQVQLAASYAGVSQSFPGSLTANGSTILDSKIGAAVNDKATAKVNELLGEASSASVRAVATYQQLAAAQPNDPNVQLELASTAEQAQQPVIAIAAYERFLEAGPGRSERVDREDAAEAAEAAGSCVGIGLIGIDSPRVRVPFGKSQAGRARLVAAVASCAAAGLLLAGCGGTVGYSEGTGDRANGKVLFTEKCGSCHTLADAGTTGQIGPNLDDAFYASRRDGLGQETIQQVVRGQIAYPVVTPPTGAPGMPADIVTGQDAEDVASYVAAVAGMAGSNATASSQPTTTTTDTTATDTATTEEPSGGAALVAEGKKVFESAGCTGCHTLADAGATGSVGPNLDEAKPDAARVTDRVTNGQGAMPAFKGQLSDDEIAAVAAYVSSVAGS